MPKKILITPKSYINVFQQMKPLLKGLEVVVNDTGKTFSQVEMLERIEDVDGLLVGVDPVNRQVVERARKLGAVSKYGVGIDNIDLQALGERGITIKTTPGTNNVSVAELTLGLLFTIGRNLWASTNSVKNGGWQRTMGVELTGKTLGLIGCGNIGREVAVRAKGLCMSVLICDPFFTDTNFLKQHAIEKEDFNTLLVRSDFISLHLPLTNETRGIISRECLEKMKSDAFIVNTSRGELVDEAALTWALKSGAVAGAACDVWTQEPPGDHPLLRMNNFILTPHIGANTHEAVLRMAHAATRNLVEMLKTC